jgi:hypothetical protein
LPQINDFDHFDIVNIIRHDRLISCDDFAAEADKYDVVIIDFLILAINIHWLIFDCRCGAALSHADLNIPASAASRHFHAS